MKHLFTLPFSLLNQRLRRAALGVLLATGAAHAQSGNALHFDGVDDYVNLPPSVAVGMTDFTFETWLNYQDTRNWTRVLDCGRGTDVNMFLTPRNGENGTPRFAITVGGSAAADEQRLTSGAVLSAGQHHLAVTLKQNGSGGVSGTLYIDGEIAATNANMTLTPSSLGQLTQLYLGRSEYGNDPYLQGIFDETRFYSTALTQAQVQADMHTGTSAVPASLLAYYNFNQGTANGNNPGETTLLDQSSNAQSGTLFNFALTGSTSNWVGGTAPLPVMLVSFAARRQREDGLLTWATAAETRNAYFEVESSPDGTTFQALGRVAGHGTTSQPQAYQFTDAALGRYATAVVYYRLRQVDTDGSSTYSPVRPLATAAAALAIEAFPVPLPAGQGLRLQVRTPQAGAAQLLVTDALGQVVLRQLLDLPASSSTLALAQAAQWRPGLYVVRVQQGSWQQVARVAHE